MFRLLADEIDIQELNYSAILDVAIGGTDF